MKHTVIDLNNGAYLHIYFEGPAYASDPEVWLSHSSVLTCDVHDAAPYLDAKACHRAARALNKLARRMEEEEDSGGW